MNGTSNEELSLKPIVEDVEDREQTLLVVLPRSLAPASTSCHVPKPLTLLEKCEHELVLGAEVAESVAFATAAPSITSSTPTARMPRRENNS